jgi:hypothetical protein
VERAQTSISAVVRPFAAAALAGPGAAYWTLRIGAALCFIGHGAFGFITKAAWLPYFSVVGIGEVWAGRLMPIVGAVDVLAGMAVLFAPRGMPLLYMTVWAMWTALLRPLAGESVFEALERAGNYGVPFALLLLTRWPTALRDLTPLRDHARREDETLHAASIALRWTVVLLLLGHGALGASGSSALLPIHYAAAGLPGGTLQVVGWFEIGLALTVALRPSAGVLLFIAAWKLATESLFLVAGAPLWELVERAGSIAAPVALSMLTTRNDGRERTT